MSIEYNQSLQIKYDVDILIAGGGPAGIAAAVTAARKGKNVFLAEMSGSFGGAGTISLIPAFMSFTDGVNFLADGIGREVHDYIKNNSPESFQPYCPNSIPVEILKLCYDEMAEEAGVRFSFFTIVTDVIVENGKVTYAVCHGKGESFAVKADMFIDCTGDGDLCAVAGAEFEKGDDSGKMMAATLCGLWTGMDWQRTVKPDSRMLEKAFEDGIFTNEDRHLPGMWKISKNIGGSNAGHIYDVDGTHYESLTTAMIAGRKQLQEYRRYYREYLDGYEETELVYSAQQIGIRETRRIVCDYRMTLQDFMDRASFDDEIGRFSYPVDIHSPRNTKEGYDEFVKDHTNLRYSKGENYGIPYRCLVVKGFKNLLTAGRCICADRSMQSSIRVMPGCYITGQAAGAAAALAASGDKNTRTVDIYELQKSLKSIGAFLPNFRDEL